MPKKCVICKKPQKEWKYQINSLQRTCSIECAREDGNRQEDRERRRQQAMERRAERLKRKSNREAKERLKSRSEWLREAQYKSFNPYIRLRDKDDLCMSCDRTIEEIESNDGWKPGGAWDAGHYLSIGSHPELRFEELNCHKQCKSCNAGSGKYGRFNKKNLTVQKRYREKLIEKIGIDKVEWLEGPHELKRYSIEEIKEIKEKYKKKIKEIKKESA